MNLLELIDKNIPLVFSTIVSVVAVCATVYQAKMVHRTQVTKLYFSAQLDAYQNLLDAFCETEKNFPHADTALLVGAGQKAMMLSTNQNARIISHFCSVYIEKINAQQRGGEDTEQLDAEFSEWKFILETYLRAEMFRFDTTKRKLEKEAEKERKRCERDEKKRKRSENGV